MILPLVKYVLFSFAIFIDLFSPFALTFNCFIPFHTMKAIFINHFLHLLSLPKFYHLKALTVTKYVHQPFDLKIAFHSAATLC